MNAHDMMKIKAAAALLPLILVAGLTACGGGGGGGSEDGGNESPSVNAGDAQTVLAGSTVKLEATASDDGSIASWSWVQTDDNADVTLSASDDSFAEFEAPSVTEETVLAFELTVTDDEGKTAKDTVEITVLPAVGLSAKVYDGPLAGAKVTVTVGDQVYTATSDANGAFTLFIGSPDPGAMILIEAVGGADQAFAELISIAGTFGALVAAAGDDGMVDASESGAVNVTNISTAKAVLMIAANGDEMPADDDAIGELEKSIDSNAILELATVIKLVIDEGAALPQGVGSTLDLVRDSDATDAVIDAAEAESAGIFQDTLNAILADPDLMPSFKAGAVPNLYFVNRAGYYIYANRGYFLELSEDGTGHLYGDGSELSAAFAWSIANGALDIAIADDDPLVQNLSCTIEGVPESCVQTTTDIRIRMISDGALTDAISVTHSGTIDYSISNDRDGAFSNTYNRLGMAPGALKKFTTEDISGTWSAPLSTHNTLGVGAEYETGLLTFNEDGTGIRAADGLDFDWTIDANSGVLSILFADGDQLDVYWLRDEGDMAIDAMFVMNTDAGETYAQPTMAAEVDDTLDVTETDADGTWDYFDNQDLVYVLNSATDTAIARYLDAAGEVTAQYPAELAFDGTKFDVISWYDVFTPVSDCTDVPKCFKEYVSSWYPLSVDEAGRIFILEVDNRWTYDDAAPGADYQGVRDYHHAQNRWLAPVSGETAGITGGGGVYKRAASDEPARGDRVRHLLGDTAVTGTHR